MSFQELFEPIKKAHAIAETIFFFEFSGRLIAGQKQMDLLKQEMKDLLPIAEEQQSVEINLDKLQNTSVLSNSDAVQFMRKGEDERPQWVVRIFGPSISIHCVEYSRWQPVKAEFEAIFNKILTSLSVSEPLLGCGLKVIDRFKFDWDQSRYDVSLLLDTSSKYVTGHAFEAGMRWHSHTGWFEPSDFAEVEVLSQLNLDSGAIMESEKPVGFVSIDHTLSLRSCASQFVKEPIIGLGEGMALLDSLPKVYEKLHSCNKSVVGNVLAKEVVMHMGLASGEA